ncbi:MAG: hypothetical protein ACRYF0_08400 [Janthinobacterium lividum]
MRLAVSILLNVLLAGWLGYWLVGQWRRASPGLRRWLLPALGWRLLLTAISSQRPSPDLIDPAKWSRLLASSFWERPAQLWPTLQSASFHLPGQVVYFYKWSNTLFLYKILALLSMVSGGVLWVNGLYLSLLCFVAYWSLVRVLGQVFPLASVRAAGVAFLAWPTVVWWTAGLTKETLVLGTGAGLMALALPLLYGRGRVRVWPTVGRAVLFLLLAWVMVRMRYFFALPLLGGLLALAAVRLGTRRGWLGLGWPAQVAGLLLGLGLTGGAAAALGGEHLSLRYFSREIAANYQHGLRTSLGRPHLAYPGWQPTPSGLLRQAPLAAAYTLVRPWPGESAQPLYAVASLENALLLALLGLALVAAWRGRAGRLPVALVVLLGLYCLLLAAFIGLSTPNLGTLSRYRVALLPWLLLLVLQNDYVRGLLNRVGL